MTRIPPGGGAPVPMVLPPGVLDGGDEARGAEVEPSRLLDHLEGPGGEALRRAGFRGRLRALAAAAERLRDPFDPLRQEALDRIPPDAGLSAAEATRILDGMALDWSLERLAAAVRSDFPDPDVLDGFRPALRGERHRVIPPGLLVQVCAGNVPGTGATALLRGLLVGAPTLLKPGSGDRVLPELLGRAVRDEGTLADGMAVVGWRGGEGGSLEAQALRRAHRVVVYGGIEAVESVRAAVGPLTPVVVYGPRVSFGVVLADATGAQEPIRDAARAVVAFEQRGCVSPHLVWVETGGARSPEAWARALAGALAELAADEAPVSDRETRAAMRGMKELVEYERAAGRGTQVFGGPGDGWMVLWEPDAGAFEPSCLGRTVRVRPLSSMDELAPRLAAVRPVLQSAAVEGAEPGRTRAALLLARAGITRITTFRDQPWPPAWWRHDGVGPLAALVRWVTLEPAPRSGPV
jgi:hypothetical protein